MPANTDEIESTLLKNISDSQVHIEDLREDGERYGVYVVSPCFKGKSRIEQHRMVYAALEEIMGDELETLTIKTEVPKK